jgi:hypothetical protein
MSYPQTTPHGFAPPPKTGASSKTVIIVIFALAGAAIFMCACLGLGIALMLPAVTAARQTARQTQSLETLERIGIALHNYHDAHKTFPPAYIADAGGAPRTSWRAMLLPYVGEARLHEHYDFNVAWDHAFNYGARPTRVGVYQNPLGGALGTNRTSYVVVTSQNSQSAPMGIAVQEGKAPMDITFPMQTAFPGAEAVGLGKIVDGSANTIAVIEIQNSDIEWAEPRDIDIDSISTDPTAPNYVDLEGGVAVVFADGTTRILRGLTLEDFKKLLTRDGGETLPEF